MTEAEIEKKWENTVWDTDIYLDDIDKLDEKKYKCGSAEKCMFGDMCKPHYDIGGCSHYKEKKPQTNEEWLRQATTEQLAEFIVNLTLLDKYKLYDQMESAEYEHGIGIGAKKVIVEWLKQPHTKGGEL